MSRKNRLKFKRGKRLTPIIYYFFSKKTRKSDEFFDVFSEKELNFQEK